VTALCAQHDAIATLRHKTPRATPKHSFGLCEAEIGAAAAGNITLGGTAPGAWGSAALAMPGLKTLTAFPKPFFGLLSEIRAAQEGR